MQHGMQNRDKRALSEWMINGPVEFSLLFFGTRVMSFCSYVSRNGRSAVGIDGRRDGINLRFTIFRSLPDVGRFAYELKCRIKHR